MSMYKEFGTTDLNKINEFLLDRMETALFLMKTEKRLCAEHSAQVVAEYGFKGNKEEVYDQLLKLFEYRKDHPYTELDFPELELNKARWMDHLEETKNIPTAKRSKILFKDTLENPTPEKWDEFNRLMKHTMDELIRKHEKKECICYCNSK